MLFVPSGQSFFVQRYVWILWLCTSLPLSGAVQPRSASTEAPTAGWADEEALWHALSGPSLLAHRSRPLRRRGRGAVLSPSWFSNATGSSWHSRGSAETLPLTLQNPSYTFIQLSPENSQQYLFAGGKRWFLSDNGVVGLSVGYSQTGGSDLILEGTYQGFHFQTQWAIAPLMSRLSSQQAQAPFISSISRALIPGRALMGFVFTNHGIGMQCQPFMTARVGQRWTLEYRFPFQLRLGSISANKAQLLGRPKAAFDAGKTVDRLSSSDSGSELLSTPTLPRSATSSRGSAQDGEKTSKGSLGLEAHPTQVQSEASSLQSTRPPSPATFLSASRSNPRHSQAAPAGGQSFSGAEIATPARRQIPGKPGPSPEGLSTARGSRRDTGSQAASKPLKTSKAYLSRVKDAPNRIAAFDAIPDEILNDITWCQALFRLEDMTLKAVPQQNRSRNLCLVALKQGKGTVKDVPPTLFHNEQWCYALFGQGGTEWDRKLPKTSAICLGAVRQGVIPFSKLPQQYRVDPVWWSSLLQYMPISQIPPAFQTLTFWRGVVKKHLLNFSVLPKSVHNDRAFLKALRTQGGFKLTDVPQKYRKDVMYFAKAEVGALAAKDLPPGISKKLRAP